MTTKEKIEIMDAYDKGESIEYRIKGYTVWVDEKNPVWDWASLEYRVKPKAKFKVGDEIVFKEDEKTPLVPSGDIAKITCITE